MSRLNCCRFEDMAMDWIEIQYRLRDYLPKFSVKSLTASRIDSAKSKDTGEQAKLIDALIKQISRRGRDPEGIHAAQLDRQLPDIEKDILTIRLDWAFEISKWMLTKHGQVWEYGSELTEDEFEHLLMQGWQKYGREKYETQQQRIDRRFPNQTKLKPLASKKPPQNENQTGRQHPPDEPFRRQ